MLVTVSERQSDIIISSTNHFSSLSYELRIIKKSPDCIEMTFKDNEGTLYVYDDIKPTDFAELTCEREKIGDVRKLETQHDIAHLLAFHFYKCAFPNSEAKPLDPKIEFIVAPIQKFFFESDNVPFIFTEKPERYKDFFQRQTVASLITSSIIDQNIYLVHSFKEIIEEAHKSYSSFLSSQDTETTLKLTFPKVCFELKNFIDLIDHLSSSTIKCIKSDALLPVLAWPITRAISERHMKSTLSILEQANCNYITFRKTILELGMLQLNDIFSLITSNPPD